jgi:hypothetical protein
VTADRELFQSCCLLVLHRGKPWPVRVAFFPLPDGDLIELLQDKTGYT